MFDTMFILHCILPYCHRCKRDKNKAKERHPSHCQVLLPTENVLVDGSAVVQQCLMTVFILNMSDLSGFRYLLVMYNVVAKFVLL